jgi:hypothetical protein
MSFFVGSALTKSITSRYEPRTNHCYGEVMTLNMADGSYWHRALYDLQTGELLAWAKNVKGKKAGDVSGRAVEFRNDVGFSDANEYIDKIMKEDR